MVLSQLSFPNHEVSQCWAFFNLAIVSCLEETLGCWRLLGRDEGASHYLSPACLLKTPAIAKAKLSWCNAPLPQLEMQLCSESSWSLIAQAPSLMASTDVGLSAEVLTESCRKHLPHKKSFSLPCEGLVPFWNRGSPGLKASILIQSANVQFCFLLQD